MAVFQARARTVDMLGHQQVSDIATAISELFKNAHDAYAKRVELDYFRDGDRLLIRDNGIGMSPEDFERRWLTLAADNAATRPDAPKVPTGMKRRSIQGEKGIGRLAIATIGPQTLILTRPPGRSKQLTMALISWRLFEIPGLNLADIEIPISHFPAGKTPSLRDVKKLTGKMRKLVENIELEDEVAASIEQQLQAIEVDPSKMLAEFGGRQVTGGSHGTVFIVTPTRGELLDDLEEIQTETSPPPSLLKTLIGFSNTLSPDAPEEPVATTFRDHRSSDDVEDVIGSHEFFTAKEFEGADHSFRGEFDAFGTFDGTVDVYGSGPQPYPWTWPDAKGRELLCGPFRLDVAYVQGEPKDSRLDSALFAQLSAKLDRIGGIYVYRDGIRVLPYGDPEFDFLQFEERRSYRASTYFFSYRRMFGAVELDSEKNAALREKAGREGFRNDRAYRQFSGMLKDFFVQVAADFFVESGTRAQEFEIGRERLRDRYRRLEEREQMAVKERGLFEKRLRAVLSAVDEGQPSADAEALISELREEAAANTGTKAERERELSVTETRAFKRLDTLRRRYRMRPPAGFGLTAELRRDWEALLAAEDSLELEVWSPTSSEISDLIGRARRKVGVAPARRDRLAELIDSAAARRQEEAGEAGSKARESLGGFESDAKHSISEALEAVAAAAKLASKEARNGSSLGTDKQLTARQAAIEAKLAASTREQLEQLETLGELLAQGLAALGSVEGSQGLAGLLEEEVLDLRDRAEQDLELAQVGMATQVISHELNATVSSVRGGLRRLSAWAEQNDELRPVYDDLRGSFDHLDSYLSLFTPLQRRLQRRREQLNGRRIKKYLHELFARRLESEQIELRVTDGFEKWQGSGYRSTVYPALVNLVDNAAFWVAQSTHSPRWIKLDVAGSDLVISDSGPGIPDRDRDAIWEFGFTRKPRGRGAGLHIAHEVLAREGWSIELDNSRKGQGAVFRISPEK